MCLSIRVQLMKTDQCQCAGLFGWTDQPETPTPVPPRAGSRRSQVQTHSNPKARKKIARHAHLSPFSFGGRERAIFSIASACECPGTGSGITCEEMTGRVFLVSRDPFTRSTINIQEMTSTDKMPFTNLRSNPRQRPWGENA